MKMLTSFVAYATVTAYTMSTELDIASSQSLIDKYEDDENMKLLMSVEVARHGERASKYIYDFTVDPEDNFTVPYNLTMTGAQSHYVNGVGLRSFFDKNQLLSQDYDQEEVYV